MKHVELSPKSALSSAPASASATLPLSQLKITLKANCLLTRRPLCFLTPPRSVFYYKNPWLWITSLLFEHGYKTEIFQLPFQNLEMKKIVLIKNKERLEKKHLIVDGITYENLKHELENIQDSTITIISSSETKDNSHFVFQPTEKSTSSISYQLHRKWCRFFGLETPHLAETLETCTEKTWHAFLDHCVCLAEIDFEEGPHFKN